MMQPGLQLKRHPELIASLGKTLLDTFRPIIPADRPVALIDFPKTMNSGDHAIWLGEKALLNKLGVKVAYQCSMETYDKAALAAAIGDGTILMHGGGNFGDIYVYHNFRLDVLRDFPKNKVIVFPQTVMFYSDLKLAESVQQFSSHPDVTIAARDVLSLYRLQKFFGSGIKTVLAPDSAFMLGQLGRNGAPRYDVVWIRRTDYEGKYADFTAEVVGGAADLRETQINMGSFADGIDSHIVGARAAGSKLLVADWYQIRRGPEGEAAYRQLGEDERSRFWVSRALRLISAGRFVITDRLHGHVLCTLTGIPHILLHNLYGKNIAFYDTWCRPLNICAFAFSEPLAWQAAQQWLSEKAREGASSPNMSSTAAE
jgi:pyruvyl transferase EpsO